MTGTGARAGPDAGLATVWAAGAVAVLVGAMMIGLHIGSAVLARHRAESAADLAALAAARLAAEGTERACRRAGEIASATGTRVVLCRLTGWEALIEVAAPVGVALTGAGVAAGRARAGPVDEPMEPEPAAGVQLLRATAGPASPSGSPGDGREERDTVHPIGSAAWRVTAAGPRNARRRSGSGDGHDERSPGAAGRPEPRPSARAGREARPSGDLAHLERARRGCRTDRRLGPGSAAHPGAY